MRRLFFLLSILFSHCIWSQELFVYTEPASNVPAKSLSVKLSEYYTPLNKLYDRPAHRVMPQISYGISQKLMAQIGVSFSDVTRTSFGYESVFLYSKYRFLSIDDVHKHFRMAAFLSASYSNAPFHFDDINDVGDKSGLRFGIIATQLWNKFAASGSISNTQLLDGSRFSKVIYIPPHLYQSVNYSLSTGFLALPKDYKNYQQLNLNLYLELLGQKAIGYKKFYVDLAPSVQLVVSSNTKINFGHRFQLRSNMQRMAENSWQLSIERTFFNLFK